MTKWASTTLISCTILLAACDVSSKSSRGFSLPDGDIEQGQVAFVEKQCTSCHTVKGLDLRSDDTEVEMTFVLGGEFNRVYTYGELVTSVINPSHKISVQYSLKVMQDSGISKMRNFNDVLTVAELIDLVAFLESRYELAPYEPSEYRMMRH